ncbi:MAG: 5,6-dimethylbenzimidazole synthase [Thiothrix sp.]|uniref:5,6-dimethylbenzimidazole synthase n=1 Tax=Thiothrix sp. TaxID=1032 RepID=UPI002609014E|nr:5,6-dimethylbenzimidazole synthase [Thiothrix sp.]MDD5395358.1 5,6-dimethylbenzimidazole synthase [Thiothrix sp.]
MSLLPATNVPHFSTEERDTLYRIIAARRDMRHFIPNTRIDDATIERLLQAAHQAPSVGLMQPWRFIRIAKTQQREHIAQLVMAEREATAQALGNRGDDFLRLKVEGIRDCAEVWVAVVAPDDGTIFGRRTMPAEMALCSVACAIQNLWLATRAENLGMGWVSMFGPAALAALLALPAGSKPIAILCLGQVEAFYPVPMLELDGWRQRVSLETAWIDDGGKSNG